MRRKNPPQTYLDRASEIEKYAKPLTLVALYTTAAFLYCVLIAILFIVLATSRLMDVSPAVITAFTIVAIVPACLIAFAWFLRPRDPISSYITGLAADLRHPIELPAEPCTFKTWLVNGETLCVDLVFYYPSQKHSEAVRERLYTCVHSALTQDFSTRQTLPVAEEVERAIDSSIEAVASECEISVLYVEVGEVHRQSVAEDPAYLKASNWI